MQRAQRAQPRNRRRSSSREPNDEPPVEEVLRFLNDAFLDGPPARGHDTLRPPRRSTDDVPRAADVVLRIITHNINGLEVDNLRSRADVLAERIAILQPDVLCLQEVTPAFLDLLSRPAVQR